MEDSLTAKAVPRRVGLPRERQDGTVPRSRRFPQCETILFYCTPSIGMGLAAEEGKCPHLMPPKPPPRELLRGLLHRIAGIVPRTHLPCSLRSSRADTTPHRDALGRSSRLINKINRRAGNKFLSALPYPSREVVPRHENRKPRWRDPGAASSERLGLTPFAPAFFVPPPSRTADQTGGGSAASTFEPRASWFEPGAAIHAGRRPRLAPAGVYNHCRKIILGAIAIRVQRDATRIPGKTFGTKRHSVRRPLRVR